MTITLRLSLCALAALTPALCAQDTPRSRTTGHVLILQNYRALSGEIERVGDQYRIRQTSGEICLPADKALWLCANWDEAFQALCKQANMRDPDERVRLARWCQQNGLHAQALAEVYAALRMRADHPAAKGLLVVLQSAAAQPSTTAAPVPARDAVPPVPQVDLSSESLSMFTSRVQPILMNTCVTCHATSRGSAFKLMRCTDATLNRRALHQNLAAVLGQVNADKPAYSPLLIKSICAHGGSTQAPLPGRQSALFQALQNWVEALAVNDPHLLHKNEGGAPVAVSTPSAPVAAKAQAPVQPAPAPPPPTKAAPAPEVASPAGDGLKPAPMGFASTASQPGGLAVPTPAVGRASTSTAQAPPRDEFDEAIFNRENHPQR